MVLLRLLELILVLVVIWTILTQIVVPGLKGAQSFPIFRKEERLVKEELEKIRQKIEEKKIELESFKQKVEEKKIEKKIEEIKTKL
jgi:dihydroorotase